MTRLPRSENRYLSPRYVLTVNNGDSKSGGRSSDANEQPMIAYTFHIAPSYLQKQESRSAQDRLPSRPSQAQ